METSSELMLTNLNSSQPERALARSALAVIHLISLCDCTAGHEEEKVVSIKMMQKMERAQTDSMLCQEVYTEGQGTVGKKDVFACVHLEVM